MCTGCFGWPCSWDDYWLADAPTARAPALAGESGACSQGYGLHPDRPAAVAVGGSSEVEAAGRGRREKPAGVFGEGRPAAEVGWPMSVLQIRPPDLKPWPTLGGQVFDWMLETPARRTANGTRTVCRCSYVVVFRHRGRQHKESFGSLAGGAGRRLRGRRRSEVASGEVCALRQRPHPLHDYARAWVNRYQGTGQTGLPPEETREGIPAPTPRESTCCVTSRGRPACRRFNPRDGGRLLIGWLVKHDRTGRAAPSLTSPSAMRSGRWQAGLGCCPAGGVHSTQPGGRGGAALPGGDSGGRGPGASAVERTAVTLSRGPLMPSWSRQAARPAVATRGPPWLPGCVPQNIPRTSALRSSSSSLKGRPRRPKGPSLAPMMACSTPPTAMSRRQDEDR